MLEYCTVTTCPTETGCEVHPTPPKPLQRKGTFIRKLASMLVETLVKFIPSAVRNCHLTSEARKKLPPISSFSFDSWKARLSERHLYQKRTLFGITALHHKDILQILHFLIQHVRRYAKTSLNPHQTNLGWKL